MLNYYNSRKKQLKIQNYKTYFNLKEEITNL